MTMNDIQFVTHRQFEVNIEAEILIQINIRLSFHTLYLKAFK